GPHRLLRVRLRPVLHHGDGARDDAVDPRPPRRLPRARDLRRAPHVHRIPLLHHLSRRAAAVLRAARRAWRLRPAPPPQRPPPARLSRPRAPPPLPWLRPSLASCRGWRRGRGCPPAAPGPASGRPPPRGGHRGARDLPSLLSPPAGPPRFSAPLVARGGFAPP